MQTMQKGYETYSTCRNAAYAKEFTRLFVNDEAKVYNDLLGLSTERTLTVEKYAKTLGGSGVKNTIVTISGITFHDDPYKENGKWKVDVAFNKRMSYYDDCGIYYNSYDFYHADYNLIATLQYDVVDSECRIESIKGSVDGYEELPEQYFVFKQTDERDRNLFYRRNPLRFNSGNQAVVEGEFDPMAFSHANPKVRRLYPEIDECNIATMGYGVTKTSSFLLRPHFDLGLGGLSIDGNSDISTSSSSFGFGVDFGLPLVESGSVKLSAFAGIGVNMSTIELDYGQKDLNVENVTDLDGDSYTRKYEKLSINQKMKLTELAVPLYLDAEFNLSSGFSLYGDVGVRFNFNMSKSVDLNSFNVDKIYGKYGPEYGGIELKYDWGYEGFYDKVNSEKSLKYAMKDSLSGVSGMTLDVIGGAGLRYNIPNTPLAIDLGLKFQLGLSEMVKAEGSLSELKIEYKSNDEHTGGTEHVNSLTDMLTSVKRNALALNIGLVFKF